MCIVVGGVISELDLVVQLLPGRTQGMIFVVLCVRQRTSVVSLRVRFNKGSELIQRASNKRLQITNIFSKIIFDFVYFVLKITVSDINLGDRAKVERLDVPVVVPDGGGTILQQRPAPHDQWGAR